MSADGGPGDSIVPPLAPRAGQVHPYSDSDLSFDATQPMYCKSRMQ